VPAMGQRAVEVVGRWGRLGRWDWVGRKEERLGAQEGWGSPAEAPEETEQSAVQPALPEEGRVVAAVRASDC